MWVGGRKKYKKVHRFKSAYSRDQSQNLHLKKSGLYDGYVECIKRRRCLKLKEALRDDVTLPLGPAIMQLIFFSYFVFVVVVNDDVVVVVVADDDDDDVDVNVDVDGSA